MQRLWSLRWDDEIPSQLLDCWFDYHQRLLYLNAINIKRWTTVLIIYGSYNSTFMNFLTHRLWLSQQCIFVLLM